MWILYQIGLTLLLCCTTPWLLLRRGKHYGSTLSGRLVRSRSKSGTHDVWIHAVSVGEVGVAGTLIEALPRELRVLVTTVTPTGQAAAKRGLGDRATVTYLPLDLGPPIERFLDLYRPGLAIFIEGEFWPLLLKRLQVRGIPRVLVNGRVSDRSFPRLRRLGQLGRRLFFDRLDTLAVQTAQDAERLTSLGVEEARVIVTGNLKYETSAPDRLPELEAMILRLAGRRQVILAGSTMPGEEELVADAFVASGGGKNGLLVLAPRHPERFDTVARLLETKIPPVVRRSALNLEEPAELTTGASCLLLDSLGELAALYRIADCCYIGGTLVPTGGHNPLEAARFGKPVVVGPSMHNFREMAEHFDNAQAWCRAQDAHELGAVLTQWLEDPSAARAVGERGSALIEGHRGATAATLAILKPLLPGTA